MNALLSKSRLVALLIVSLALTLTALPGRTYGQQNHYYTMTIFVDEGHGELNGHVFVCLSDGTNSIYRGFYSKHRSVTALAGLDSGEVRDDAHHYWDVKKPYRITPAGYANGLKAIENWRSNGQNWTLHSHCGDFVEYVAGEAGANLNLPRTILGTNRPGVFGEYLREHGAILRTASNADGTVKGTHGNPIVTEVVLWRLVDVMVVPNSYQDPKEVIQLERGSLTDEDTPAANPGFYRHALNLSWDEPPSTLAPGQSLTLKATGDVREIETENRDPIGFGRQFDWNVGSADKKAGGGWNIYPLSCLRRADNYGQAGNICFIPPGSGYKKVVIPGERKINIPVHIPWDGKAPIYVEVSLDIVGGGDVFWIYQAAAE